jgi:hypothetical protein
MLPACVGENPPCLSMRDDPRGRRSLFGTPLQNTARNVETSSFSPLVEEWRFPCPVLQAGKETGL